MKTTVKGGDQDELTPELINLRLLSQRMKGETLGLREEKTWNKEGFLHTLVFFLIIFLCRNLSHHNFPFPQHTCHPHITKIALPSGLASNPAFTLPLKSILPKRKNKSLC